MSRVEWKKLGDLCEVQRGKRLTKNLLDDNAAYPVYHGGLDPLGKYGQYNREANTVMVINVGASAGTVGFSDCKFWSSDGCFCISHSELLDNKYLFYYLQTKTHYLQSQVRHAGIPTLDNPVVEKIMLPLLSMSEQNRIVGILDTFTASIDNLKEQIAQRRKQYEYYRDQLLDLQGKEGVEMKMLGDICDIKGRIGFRGYTREDQVEKGEGVISLSPGNIEEGKMVYDGCTYITWKKYNESPEIKTFNGDVLFCKTGSTVGKVAMVDNLPCEATINPQLVVLKKISVNSKFLKYSLGTYRIQAVVKRLAGVGSVPNISQEKLGNLEILLPSLSEQQRIVDILDKFEASIKNLEAQLAQREKQYEYNRNKLLTFE